MNENNYNKLLLQESDRGSPGYAYGAASIYNILTAAINRRVPRTLDWRE